MKSYYVEVVVETGDWTDGWACGRCEDAQLIAGKIVLCLGVKAHTEADALTKAVTAARTAIHNAGTATLRWQPAQLKLLDGDEPFRLKLLMLLDGDERANLKLVHDRKQPERDFAAMSAEEQARDGEVDRVCEAIERVQAQSPIPVNGADCWAVILGQHTGFPNDPNDPMRSSMFGCWLSSSA